MKAISEHNIIQSISDLLSYPEQGGVINEPRISRYVFSINVKKWC